MMSDLISRQDVNDLMRKYGFKAPDMTIKEFVEDCIPSAEPERKWIPVTEALPEEDDDVLLLMTEGEMTVGQRRGLNYWDGYRTRAVIVAWMPLPEPWRGEV